MANVLERYFRPVKTMELAFKSTDWMNSKRKQLIEVQSENIIGGGPIALLGTAFHPILLAGIVTVSNYVRAGIQIRALDKRLASE